MEVDLYGGVNKKRVTSGFRLKVMIGGYICVFGYLYIVAIFWNYIQSILRSLRLALFF